MDSILVIGKLDDKLTAFFKKVGYHVFKFDSESDDKVGIPQIIREQFIDLVLVDSISDKLGHEFVTFLRTQDSTRDVPIVVLAADKLQTLQIKELNFDKIEILQSPFSLGTVVSKIATSLRIRKTTGLSSEKASISDANIALRDLNERHQKELHEARAIQDALLPKKLPQGEKFEFAASYRPLEEVGGDFYTIEETKSGDIRLLSADVTGHGLPAAFIGSMTKLALVAVDKEDPGELLQGMNALLAPIIPQGRFVTANSYLYKPETGKLLFARAGGPQALLFDSKRENYKEILGEGFPLAFFEEGSYPTGQEVLNEGDVLVVVTDGITEAQNRNKEFFGFEGIVNSVRKSSQSDSAQTILDSILNDFTNFIDGRLLKDDVTVLVLIKR